MMRIKLTPVMNKVFQIGTLAATLSFSQTSYTLQDADVTIDENGYITECNYDFSQNVDGTDLTIPDTLNGKVVEGIADKNVAGVFTEKNITALTLPNTVEKIGSYSFNKNNIKRLDLSDLSKLTIIGASSFQDNYIESLDLGNCESLQKFDDKSFIGGSEHSKLTSLDLSKCNQLERIGKQAFGYQPITNLDLGECKSLSTIDGSAFLFSRIDSIDFSKCNKLKSVGSSAFRGNRPTGVEFGECNSLKTIGEWAFERINTATIDLSKCNYLDSIGVMAFANGAMTNFTLPTHAELNSMKWLDTNGNDYVGGTVVNDLNTSYVIAGLGVHYYEMKYELDGGINHQDNAKYYVPNVGVGTLYPATKEDHLFAGWYSENTFENRIYTVATGKTGDQTLWAKFVKIKHTLQDEDVTIDENGYITGCTYDFSKNEYGTELTIPETIGGKIIKGIVDKNSPGVFTDKNITALTLPSTIEKIGNFSFRKNNIKRVDISALTKLSIIGNEAFSYNYIEAIDFGKCDELIEIGNNAFFGASPHNKLTTLDLSQCSKLQKIGSRSFSYQPITSFDLGDCESLDSIGSSSFLYSKIESLDFSKCGNLKSIGSQAFHGNRSKKLEFGECQSLNSLGGWAFEQINTATIDLSKCTLLDSIGLMAFANGQVTEFTLPTHEELSILKWVDTNKNSIDGGTLVSDLKTSYVIPGKGTQFFNISYNLDNGTNHQDNPRYYITKVGLEKIEPATKSDYEFMGWFSEETLENEINKIEVGNIGDTVFWAKFTLILTGDLSISGKLQVGQDLSAAVENTNNSGTLSYQWKREGKDIDGATSEKYTLTKDDIDAIISVDVVSTVEYGTLNLAATEKVADKPSSTSEISEQNLGIKAFFQNQKLYLTGLIAGQKVQLHNVSAKIIQMQNATSDKMQWDLNNLSNGVYFLRIKGYSHKFVISK